MSKIRRFLSSVPLIALLWAGPSWAGLITVGDGSFAAGDWTFSQVVGGGPDGANFATVSTTTAQGSPQPALDVTTSTFTVGKPAYGVALYNPLTYDPSAGGAVTALTLSIDFLSGPGAFASGQAVSILALQAGRYFRIGGINTGVSGAWLNTGFSVSSPTANSSWLVGTELFETLPVQPDFSASGAPIQFGFTAGNHISTILTNYYDNWSLSIQTRPPGAVPEPGSLLLLAGGLIILAGLGWLVGRHRRRD